MDYETIAKELYAMLYSLHEWAATNVSGPYIIERAGELLKRYDSLEN